MRARYLLPVGVVGLVLASVLLLRAQSTQEFPHGDLALDCAQCHSSERWAPIDAHPAFRHETTGFALEGAHGGASCTSCHRSLVFHHVGTACADCHRDAHRGELGFRCESCHTTTTWTNQREMFQVHSRTRFPLFSIHARLDCAACHRNQRPFQFASTPAECGGCHFETYTQTTNPHHVQAGFSRRCEECHRVTSTTWEGAPFSHTPTFPLVAGHAGLTCAHCHTSALYAGLSTACFSCHQQDYNRTTNPNHAAGGFPTSCEDCHTIDAWRPATFDHDLTGFPLTGAHGRVLCAECHVGGRFTGTPSDCASCHREDYNRAKNPDHSGFSMRCEDCHGTGSWRPANFNHNRTRFPLTGAHTRVDCEQCHVGGRFAGTPTDCYSCHEADYAATTDPNHQAANFPTRCQTCHTTSAWRPANFDHNRTRFPLTGAHTRVDCALCHVGGRYTGTPTDCYACHQADYAATTNPNHPAAGFPTRCQDCHTTSGWRPADFDHDGRYFPIYSGKHRGQWSTCGECHVNPGNFKVFECILCHRHSDRPSVDDDHRDVPGYVYQSAACYRCHPSGTKSSFGRARRLP